MFDKSKRRNLRKGLERQKGPTLVMVKSYIPGIMDMVVLSLDNGSLVKDPPMTHLSPTKIGFLTVGLNEENVVYLCCLCLLVLGVERSTRTHHEKKGSLVMVIGMLKVFQLDVYSLLDPNDTLSFMTPYVALMFDVLPDVLLDPSYVSTPVGDSIVAKWAYRECPISLSLDSLMLIL
ncbi:hypothetical protein MTR67_018238 [Solanum verrucosum]|uniref:Uncharacterized protein n=1 Tax=Solanum verrucosum TaxID=315347 RepID=A0AAF0QKL8_SOLVR|nr:hypothetical protein MTR67_018238 [Solanum verrucosum]